MLIFGPVFKRPSAALLALYGELPSATVSDVLGPGYVLDGVVVIPVERAEEVAGEVVRRFQKESERIAAIRQGAISPAWLEETMARVGVVKG
jgi:hypothetical protein